MPLKLNVCLSRKVGEANFGSRGATVGLELEADTSLVHQPDQFYDQIAQLFALARQSVDRELARPPSPAGNGAARNGTSSRHPRLDRAATANQIRALHAIASEQGVDLTAEVNERFGAIELERLSLHKASELIDALRSNNRNVNRNGNQRPLDADVDGSNVHSE